jgi:hypothetical protein
LAKTKATSVLNLKFYGSRGVLAKLREISRSGFSHSCRRIHCKVSSMKTMKIFWDVVTSTIEGKLEGVDKRIGAWSLKQRDGIYALKNFLHMKITGQKKNLTISVRNV